MRLRLAPIDDAAPADYPVTIDQVRAHLRVDGTADDDYLLALIGAATRQCEQETGRKLVTQTWDVLLDAFPCGEWRVPLSPLQSVTAITYYDADNALQTLATSVYQVTDGRAPRLALAAGQAWPAVYSRMEPVQIRCVVGYGDPEDVPLELVQWILLQIGHWYENREAATAKTMSKLAFVDGLLDRERVVVVG